MSSSKTRQKENYFCRDIFGFTEANPILLALQITEANYKMFHPEIFSSPWVQVTVRGRSPRMIKTKSLSLCRVQIKMWAVVRIQRCFKRFLKRKAQQKESKKKVLMIKVLVSRIVNKHFDHIDFVLSARTRRSVGRSTSRETITFLLRPQLLRSIDLVVKSLSYAFSCSCRSFPNDCFEYSCPYTIVFT